MMATMSVGGPGDPHTQMNTYRSYVTMLADSGAKDEIKLKAAQELSENFEVILGSPQYPQFLDHSLKIFLKILQEGEPHFIAEYNIQQVRKLILEMIHRLPISETLRPYVKSILILMLKLMEIENEENVLVCLKIFMELHKQYRPAYSTEVDIHKFLQWVKGIYSDLPNHLPKIFEPKPTIRVKDLSEINIEQMLQETYTTTPIHTEKKLLDGSVVTYNLIPRSVLSLKVIQELPIIVVLMYQLYKQNVHQEVSNFIPLIMETITLQPAATHRQSVSFNKEVFVDFMGAQIKTLAFLAYIIRIYQETIANHANLMVKGIIGLLTLCPPEVAHLRKELVIATRHILATDLRLKFVPYMERLFDEEVLLGGGWTVHESLRPLAYSTLADLVHHVRQHLPLTDLAIAAHLFSKNVHDESLPTSIQTMSCKLLLNLVDCIRQRSESEGAAAGAQPQGRQLLMRILEVFVLKFKTISKLQLPALMAKCKTSTPTTPAANSANGTTPSTPTTPAAPGTPAAEVKVEEEKPTPDFLDSINKPEEKSKIGFPSSQMNNLNVGDYRTLVKTLVCGVKTITWGCASCKTTTNAEGTSTTTITGQKQFSARETLVFIRLVRWGLQSLDIYTLAAPRQPAMPPAQPHVRSKEEKEVLEHFSGVFSMMNPQTFQEIFTATISHMVERINKNMTLQIIANTFLSNPATSPIFATVLVEYLLKRMEEMGTNVERSNLYLRLFKLVFGSVSLFPTENEQMLRPHLHSIVNKAMDYAMTAKEPYNYFLLLRALFRSIGGGSHDLLYQEFLPLLPNLLEGLNRLQSGLHKQHMKDLFVELCLTVPVRLSSLLPYLPMLMDPLVSALNGSHTLISQGLRTLELCVDNLQPDFLYEHIQPVRADLMQALWRTLQNNEVARIAFRVLGKFGGGNRKMMIEPQSLEYRETDAPPPAVQAYFQDQPKPIDFEVDKVIDTAFSALKSSTTDPFYRRQCWEVLRCYLAASLNLDDDRQTLLKLFNHPSFVEGKIHVQNGPYYKCANNIVRNTHRTALTGMFVAAAIKELRHHVLPTMVSLVRHYTMVAIAQEAGPFAGTGGPKEGLDALVLVDAIAVVMGHEEKELCKPGHLALVLMIETAATVLGSKERACRLPLMEYLAERMSALCYERAWYAKLGGCIAVKFMVEKMAPEWVYKHIFTFLKAVLFVMMDLTGEVSSGAIDMATVNLERLVRVCVTGPAIPSSEPSEGELAAAKARALHDVLQELVLQVTSPHLLVRQQAMKSLELIAELQNKTVTEVMDPHREVLADIIPPKKHLLRHQPANAQMGLMDGTTFCTTLKPRLFTIDLNINEHKVFFRELLSLCEAEDAMLGKLPCYKGVNLVPLRASALKALAACHYIQEKHCREKIFQVLYKSLEKNDQELQQAGFECMQKFLSGFQIDMEMVHPVMRPLLLTLGDHRNLSVNGAKRLSYLTQLFPSTFSEKLCEQLLQLLKKLLDYSIQTNRGGNFLQSVSKNMENEQKIIILIGIFHQIPAASPRFIDVLCRLIFHTEKSLMIEAGSPFREPLVKFLLRYPKETLDLILSDNNIKEQQWSRFLVYLVKHPEAGAAYREALQTARRPRLMQLLAVSPAPDRAEMQFQAIRVVSLLIKYDDQWLSTQHDLVELIKRVWCSDQYHVSACFICGLDRWLSVTCGIIVCISARRPRLMQLLAVSPAPDRAEMQFQAIRVVSLLIKYDDQWLSTQHDLVELIKRVWCSDQYHVSACFICGLDRWLSVTCGIIVCISARRPRLMQLLAVSPAPDRAEMQFQAIRVVSLLIKYDDQWLSTQHDLVELIKRVWCSDQYHVSACFICGLDRWLSVTCGIIVCISARRPRLMQLLAVSPAPDRAEMQFQAIRVVSLLIKYDDQWLSTQHDLVELIKRIWCSDQYHEIHKKVENVDCTHWKEPKLIVKILLHYFCHHPSNIDLLFQLLRALCDRFIPDFQFLRDFLENTVAQNYTVEWKRSAFFRFVEHFASDAMSQDLKAKVLQMILIPCFAVSFEKGQKIVGGPPAPYQDNPDNVVSVFINNVIDPENPFACSDAVRISLLQFACLLLEQASAHIHDANNKKQGNKLRRLMTFAWPCLLGKNYVDPATRYHGHLLLSHIIAKFAIHKRIVLQVFHSLLKAHAVEARSVVRQALEILTPAMPQRMEDGNTMLTHWTKKIIVEDGHSVQQLFHILQLVVRHYKVYYPVRHALVGHMVAAMQRLGFSATASLEHRRLAVDLAEVALKWELQRIRDHSHDDTVVATSPGGGIKRMSVDENMSESRKALNTGWASPQASSSRMEPDAAKPLDRQHVDVVVNLLLRLACQVNEGNVGAGAAAGAAAGGALGAGSPGEQLSRRCVLLLKAALKPDVWPHHCEPKLAWLDKVFSSAESNAGMCANACTALELLAFLLGVLRRDQALAALKPLQRGLAACVASANAKIVRLTHNLLAKLTALFPTEPSGAAQASKYEELETLYACVSKYAFEGLATYEKSAAGGGAGALLGPLMMLKACCASSAAYVDRLLLPLMRVLQRMARDHVAPSPDPATSDLLILALDLLKARVSVMPVDTRKTFIGTVLVGLIEKTTDAKVMKAITRMVEEWVKNRSPATAGSSSSAAGAAPSLREKSILLVKLMQYVEKRFPDDLELNAHFLDIINYVYRDDTLKVTELSMKLEPAFLAGLRCPQPHIRAKFFEVYDQSVRRRIFDRLLYIICSQNWEHIGQHFWIRQCLELLLVTCVSNGWTHIITKVFEVYDQSVRRRIFDRLHYIICSQNWEHIGQYFWIRQCLELLLVTCVSSTQIRLSNTKYLLPNIAAVINWADSEDRKSFVIFSSVKEESSDGFSDSLDPDKDDVLDMDLDSSSTQTKEDLTKNAPNRQRALTQIINKQSEFLELARRVRTEQLVLAAAQLCHMDDALAHHTWLRLFPRLWAALDDRQLGTVMNEIVPFIISGVHVIQRDQPLSALNTFIEALARCSPPVSIKPSMMKYLGKTHNLWHRMTLNLEQMAIDQATGRAQREPAEIYDYEVETTTPTEILDSLSDMYELLQEEDMWSGLWQKHARYRETNVAIAYEQQGFFEQAQAAYDIAMAKLKQDYAANPSAYNMHKECNLWTNHWLKCAKELNQWDSLLELGLTRSARDPFLILESSWRNPNWPTMKDALAEVEYNCPKELAWLVNLYRGYLCICAGGEQQLSGVERHAEAAAAQCLREWRRLPRVVSHAHLPLLRAAQQLMELSEAAQIHTGLLHSRPTSLHDMKAIVKTWRNRLPVVADPLSHWGAIFTWRQHHYQFIASHYDSQTEHASNHSMLGVHASAQAIIHFAKIARKHNLSGVCLDSLHRIYTIPSVPIVDCFQKIRQQVKCHIQMSWTEGKDELQEGLDMIESTNFKYFTKEMTAEFYAFKGLLLAQLGRSEDANKAFAAAVQLHDTLVKAWALWGDYLEQIFIRDPRQTTVGVSAMTCFLHACRHQNESKSRKYCAKVLWMLSFDDEKNSLAEALDKYSVGVPPVQWLPWIPQLLACLVQYDGNVILNLLSHVGRLYPQAVYFPIRTLYLTLKIEQRERHKTAENIAAHLPHQPTTSAGNSKVSEAASSSSGGSTGSETGSIKATLPMWRCSKIMQLQREIHPTVLSSLEGIVDQMVWFRENWYEEVLRQLRAGLAKCHVVAFHHRAAVADATVTQHTLNFIKKVVSTFGIGIGITASESLARRAQATVQDPVFQKMKSQFTADFDFTQPNAMKLQNLIQKLRKWVKILEAKTKVLPKSFLIEEKCRFLSNFSLKTAEVELPGEFLLPKHTHYHVRIARFMPRVEIVQKHNTSARRLYIRGHNGKIYPYLVVNDSGLGDARREERVLQLLRMLNHYLGKQKETSRRFLHFTVPRVVSVSPQMRLVEDNPTSISLLDIYRTECANRGVEYDAPVARYYERLAAVQARGSQASHQVLRDILREVQATMVPKGMVREWAMATFAAPTDYWTFRKMLTLQLSLASFAEYVLHLTRLNPDMMYVHQDSGLLNVSYFKFDVDDTTGELDGNRPVPFRLTPNISELLTSIGITGPLTASAIAVARCLVTPNFKIQSILRTILRDEMVTGYRKRLEDKSGLPTAGTSAENKPMEMDNETIINMVNKAVTVIMNRLNSLATFDGPDSKVATLVTAANSHDNLCRMDPAWHPWL